jgi:3-methyladenine DNA glycosylase AlkC
MAKLLKNLYNKTYIDSLADEIKKVYKDFDKTAFVGYVFDETWDKKELKQRMRHISVNMGLYLPFSYKKNIEILKEVFKNIASGYYLENMVFQDFVEVYGLDDFKVSMGALEVFTDESSSEFAIRQFILKYPKQSMAQMRKWAKSNSHHVRRLASEGCRPRLPWAMALEEFKKDPTEVLKVLEILKDDESAYVRKSVANSLNDISKDNPGLVKKTVKKWFNKKRKPLLKHACRTLLKAADKEVLKLFGYTKPENLLIKEFKISKDVKMGEDLSFSFVIKQEKIQKLRLEYKMHFLRSNGTYSEKVFKISELESTCSEKKIEKKHSFKTISTRKYYKGVQKISIIINGVEFREEEFVLS